MNHAPLVLLACLTIAASTPAQFLMAVDGTTDMVVTFDPFNGSVINPALFPVPNTTQVAAIDVNGEIWITEQTGDRITRRDVTGSLLASIGPTFPGGGFDNIRGLLYAYGFVYVTNFGASNGATANSVVILDAAGNHVSTFAVNTLATNPFAVVPFQGDILVSGFSNNKDVYRFTPTGTPVGIFHDSTTIAPAHGLALASDGNVWCVGFTSQNVCKLDATTGAILTSFPAPSTPRGVHELGNGNVMWTNGSGVQIYDIVTQTSTQVFTGTCNHVSLYGSGVVAAAASPYGIGCDSLVLAANGLPQLGNASFALLLNNVAAVSPVGLFAFGSTAVNPGIDLTGLGMTGCFAATSLDVGLFTGGLVAAGTSAFPLAIPNAPTLTGTMFSAQGLSFSLATPLGLVSSNGMLLVLGN